MPAVKLAPDTVKLVAADAVPKVVLMAVSVPDAVIAATGLLTVLVTVTTVALVAPALLSTTLPE